MTTLPLPPRPPADLDTWLATSPPIDVAIGLVLAVAAALLAYVSAVGVLYGLALLLRAPGAVRALASVTPAWVRAVAERAVAVSLLTATWAAPTAATAATRGADVLPPGLRVPATAGVGEERAPALELPMGPRPGPAPPPERVPQVAPPRREAQAGPVRASVTVAPGDHLWGIAARAVAAARGVDVRDVPVGDVAAHWVEVVRVNRPYLRSGDPDVIHPGETVRLPPVARTDR